MGSSDKNSRAACLPLTTRDYTTIIQDDSVNLMTSADKEPTQESANAGNWEKHLEEFEVDEWSKDITCYTAVQFDLEFNNPVFYAYSICPKTSHMTNTLHRVPNTHFRTLLLGLKVDFL